MAPERTASIAGLASVAASTYHWSVSQGSMTTPRAIAVRHGVDVRLDLLDQTELPQARDDLLARNKAVQSVQFLNRLSQLRTRRDTLGEVRIAIENELSVRAQYVDLRQRVASADLEIVEVVRGRDLHRA